MIGRVRPSRFMFPETAVITPPTESIGSSGAPGWTWPSGSVTFAANLQPVSAADSMQYGRETGTNIYELFILPTDTSGTALALTQAQLKNARVVVAGKTLRVIGGSLNPITAGVVYQLTCEEDY